MQEHSRSIPNEDESNARFAIDLPLDASDFTRIDWTRLFATLDATPQHPCITIHLYNVSRLRSDWLFAMHSILQYAYCVLLLM
jgi:hypothetical protein